MIEQLPYARQCTKYKFDFDILKVRIPTKYIINNNEVSRQNELLQEIEVPEHPTGSTRTEGLLYEQIQALKVGMPKIQYAPLVNPLYPDILLKIPVNNDLPLSMQYRTNKQVSKYLVKMGRSPIHEWGVFARTRIEENTLILEYTGEIIRQKIADEREKRYDKKGIGCYMFRIDDEIVIDATMKGNLTRFVNHCCNPNCVTRIHTIDGQKKILLFAKRLIQPGEELTYDYMFAFEEGNKIPCNCGATKCRGSMN